MQNDHADRTIFLAVQPRRVSAPIWPEVFIALALIAGFALSCVWIAQQFMLDMALDKMVK